MRGALDKGGNPRVPPCSRGGWRVTAAQHYAPSPPTAVQLRGGGVPLEVSGGAGLLRWHTHTHTPPHTHTHTTHTGGGAGGSRRWISFSGTHKASTL